MHTLVYGSRGGCTHTLRAASRRAQGRADERARQGAAGRGANGEPPGRAGGRAAVRQLLVLSGETLARALQAAEQALLRDSHQW